MSDNECVYERERECVTGEGGGGGGGGGMIEKTVNFVFNTGIHIGLGMNACQAWTCPWYELLNTKTVS